MCEPKSFKLWLLQIFALLDLLAFFLWLGLRPKNPSYDIVDFSVPISNNSGTTPVGDQSGQNGTLSFNLEIRNPNKDSSIYYDDIMLIFYYNEDTVGQKTIPHFHQGKDKTTQIIDHVEVNARVWKALVNAISTKTAELKVVLRTRVQHQTWGIKSKHHGMHLQGHARIGSDGKIYGKKKKIKLHKASKKRRI